MPHGKPAGMRCVQLTADNRCAVFGSPLRPKCCSGLRPSPQMCGTTREEALETLAGLEQQTAPE